MKITWLGQAGLLVEANHLQILIDPYLSNSVAAINPRNFRRVPVKKELFEIRPDVMIFTHDHLDHYDPETASVFLDRREKAITVLSPASVWQKVRTLGGCHNYVQFDRHTEWTERGIRFRAVKAEHSDAFAIGILIEDLADGKCYYVTGDTLYNTEILADLPKEIEAVFLPVNGVGNNMNATDAERFAAATGARWAVPMHVGMFDELTPDVFKPSNRILPELYKEINL